MRSFAVGLAAVLTILSVSSNCIPFDLALGSVVSRVESPFTSINKRGLFLAYWYEDNEGYISANLSTDKNLPISGS